LADPVVGHFRKNGVKLKFLNGYGIIKVMEHRNRLFLTLAVLFIPVFTIFGADIFVSNLDIAARGFMENGELVVSSRANMDISLNGGYKFNVFLGWTLDAADLGRALAFRNFALDPLPSSASQVTVGDYNALLDRFNNQAVLSLNLIKATARDLFGIPLELSFFMGKGDVFGNGDMFFSRWGKAVTGTDFTGYYFFPEGIGKNPSRHYNGVYAAEGTGVSVAYTGLDFMMPAVYAYEEFSPQIDTLSQPSAAKFSGDARFLFNFGKVSADIFGGVTFEKDEELVVRAGFLLFFSAGNNEFFIQAGMPGYNLGKPISVDYLYALAEQRLFYGVFSEHFTVFYHPAIYQNVTVDSEKDRLDLNLKLALGEKSAIPVMGGSDFTAEFKIGDLDSSHFRVSPFINFRTSGFEWTLRARYDVLETDWEKALDFFVGMRASF
jgi:hypothetical protein